MCLMFELHQIGMVIPPNALENIGSTIFCKATGKLVLGVRKVDGN